MIIVQVTPGKEDKRIAGSICFLRKVDAGGLPGKLGLGRVPSPADRLSIVQDKQFLYGASPGRFRVNRAHGSESLDAVALVKREYGIGRRVRHHCLGSTGVESLEDRGQFFLIRRA